MKNLSFILVLLLISFTYVDKGIKKHVKENLHIVRSIDPQDTNFEDLSDIGNAIGDAQLVLLGEQCHGDGATFAAKSRLIKYLHEKKGFNVLAFEADFFTLNDNPDRQRGINNIWSEAEECHDLLNNYIPATNSTNTPLIVTGIDNQFYGQIGSSRLKDFLKTSVKPSSFSKDISHLMDVNFYNSLDSMISSLVKSREQLLNPSSSHISLLKNFDHSLDTLLSYANPGSSNYDLQVIKNIKTFNTLILNYKDNLNSVRDSMMAENIHWLINQKFKNQKIIVWAANSHICKQKYWISYPVRTMGSFLEPKFQKKDIYTIGFTSREGTHGVFRTTKINKPLASNMENWIPNDINYAFLDLKKRADLASENFTTQAIGHGNLKMTWQTKFDGLFYIKEMYPSHKIKKQN